jgi:hypothetical protein
VKLLGWLDEVNGEDVGEMLKWKKLNEQGIEQSVVL